jgi:hypothetical protein
MMGFLQAGAVNLPAIQIGTGCHPDYGIGGTGEHLKKDEPHSAYLDAKGIGCSDTSPWLQTAALNNGFRSQTPL